MDGGRPARSRSGLRADLTATPEELATFVKERIGGVKTPKQVEVWADLPRSKVGKVLKADIRASLQSLEEALTDAT
jgi:fatty-acyl-CoA synthase